jgi:WD40 repeat protein
MLRSIARLRHSSEADDSISGGEISHRRRFRFCLPSPFLVGVVVVFVILPLVWVDDKEGEPSRLPARATYDLRGDVTAVALAPDGQLLAASGREQPIFLWSNPGGKAAEQFLLAENRRGGTRCLAFSPDGRVLAGGNVDGSVTLWDMATKELLRNLECGDEMVLAIAFSPDGSLLSAASADTDIRVWQLADGGPPTVLKGHAGPVTALAYSPDGRALYSGSEDQTIRGWNLDRQETAMVLSNEVGIVMALACSPDGSELASSALCDQRVRLWSTSTGESLGVLSEDAPTSSCLLFSPDGEKLLTGDEHGYVGVWNMATMKEQKSFLAHHGWLKAMTLDGNGRTLASGGNDGFLRVWDLDHTPDTAHHPT